MGVGESKLSFINPSMLINKLHLEAAIYCKNVYKDDFIKKCDHFIDHKETDTQCIVNKENEKLFVCFRGSDHIKDWKSNFTIKLEKILGKNADGKRKFHGGFMNSWCSVKEDVKKDIEEAFLNKDIKTVIFTGHSAGTVANLAAYDLHEFIVDENNRNIEVITFGSPRCCNSDFEVDYEKKIKCTRFVLDRDIITMFPFGIGYRHLGNPIQMREKEVLNRDTSIFESFKWLVSGFPFLDIGISDHNIEKYIEELQKYT